MYATKDAKGKRALWSEKPSMDELCDVGDDDDDTIPASVIIADAFIFCKAGIDILDAIFPANVKAGQCVACDLAKLKRSKP